VEFSLSILITKIRLLRLFFLIYSYNFNIIKFRLCVLWITNKTILELWKYPSEMTTLPDYKTALYMKWTRNFNHGTDTGWKWYPDFGHPVAYDVEWKAHFGIVICMVLERNCNDISNTKIFMPPLCWTKEIAELAKRQHNDAIL
jgi:hypothetical protein